MVIWCNSEIESKGIGIYCGGTIERKAYWEVEAVMRRWGLVTCMWAVVPWCDGQVSADGSAECLCWASVLTVSTRMGVKDSVGTWRLSARKRKLFMCEMFMTASSSLQHGYQKSQQRAHEIWIQAQHVWFYVAVKLGQHDTNFQNGYYSIFGSYRCHWQIIVWSTSVQTSCQLR